MNQKNPSSCLRDALEHPYLYFGAEDIPVLREQCKGERLENLAITGTPDSLAIRFASGQSARFERGRHRKLCIDRQRCRKGRFLPI